VRVEHRAVVDLGAGRPVALEATALEPLLGDVGEREPGALLAQLPMARVNEDFVEAFFSLSFAKEACSR
jgi:hypothetical protein